MGVRAVALNGVTAFHDNSVISDVLSNSVVYTNSIKYGPSNGFTEIHDIGKTGYLW